MKILLSNDDGIYAPGMIALYQALKDLGEIYVVAPDSQRSAISNAITIHDPIRIKKVEVNGLFTGYAVSGTPTDCIKLAVHSIMPEQPDIIVSGINLGQNVGSCILYSGTVSAATEGAILGIPSMAISLATFFDPIWETAAHYAHLCAEQLYQHGMPPSVLLNVNVPNIPLSEIRGLMVTRAGSMRFAEKLDKRQDPHGNTYYWLNGQLACEDSEPDTDVHAIDNGYVSLTPIGLDRTHHASLNYLRSWLT